MRRFGRITRLLLVAGSLPATLGADGGARADVDDLAAISQRFEAGEVLTARSAYLELLSHTPSAAVHYNLGRVDHALGARPQAALWYRRALELAPDDPWARENLSFLRDELGLPAPNAGWPLSALYVADTWSGWLAALALAVVLVLRGILGRPRGWLLLTLSVVIVSGHAAVHLAARSAPVDAVLMSACGPPESNLPAGSEVWVSRRNPAQVWSAGTRFECDSESIIPVRSDQLPPEPAAQSLSADTGARDAAGHRASAPASVSDGPLA